MVVSGQFHALATLSPGKEPPEPSGWASDHSLDSVEERKCLTSARNWALIPQPDVLTLRPATPCINN